MSGMIPFFLTGANAKVRVNNKTIAFCTDLSYSIKVAHVNPKVLGMYEGHSVTPLSYEVTGSFTIIKYTRGMAEQHDGLHGDKLPFGVTETGNGIGAWGPDGVVYDLTASGNDGRANQSLNPVYLKNSVMFDIEVYQKGPHNDEVPVAQLPNCRIIQSDFKLSKRGVATQTFQFIAVYANEDTFVTSASGVGQNLGS